MSLRDKFRDSGKPPIIDLIDPRVAAAVRQEIAGNLAFRLLETTAYVTRNPARDAVHDIIEKL